jgi:hypothetical protein
MSGRTVIVLVASIAIAAAGIAYAVGFAHGRAALVAAPTQVPSAQPAQVPVDPFQPPPQFQVPEPFQAPRPFQAPQPLPGPQPAPGPQPFQSVPPGQSPPPLREFIPLPGPGDQTPGQQPQQQNGDCEPIILFYHNGQLYQLRPGQGPQDGQGRPGTPPEFYYLNPYQGPPIPGLPAPRPDRGPGFSPVNPRS